VGDDSGKGGSKAGGSGGELAKQYTKNGKESINWHSRCVTSLSLYEHACRDKHVS
jgi:ATP-dependent Lon protease